MFETTKLRILKLTYCGFSAKIDETNTVVYGWKYPPTIGSTHIPDFSANSTDEELKSDAHVDREVFVDFVKSQQTRQADGTWKGGSWGTNNFTVTSTNWFPEMYVGDTFSCQVACKGVCKYSPKPFDVSQTPIPNSEQTAWSCNGTWNDKTYAFYMTGNPMPQRATDKLWMWGCSTKQSKLRIKVLRRGSGPDVDCPNRIAPAAGEHLEPGQSDDSRAQVLFAINQEIGIPQSTLSKCYLLDLGTYATPGRDPRYWTYNAIQDGQVITFGIPRDSSSVAHILYIETDDEVEPEETEQEDKTEIKSKWWQSVYGVFDSHPESDWMLEDHMKFIPDSIARIAKFRVLEPEAKQKFKF
jgi:hypothetical protein